MKPLMFDQDEMTIRLHGKDKFVDALDVLRPVETFFLEVMQDYPSIASYDCGAAQPMQFWTVNYTSFAGFFMMHPLQHEMKHYQIQEALTFGKPDKLNYADYFAGRVKSGASNKYQGMAQSDGKYKSLVVLSGTNIFDRAVCINKLRWIVEQEGKLAAIKPHPLTSADHLENLPKMLLPSANILQPKDDMYSIMPGVETVYAPHSSESIVQAVCLGKQVSPLTSFQHRLLLGFSHINEPLFQSQHPKDVVNIMFSDYRSGLVHPVLHSDWQDRVVKYLGYIHEMRVKFKDAYK